MTLSFVVLESSLESFLEKRMQVELQAFASMSLDSLSFLENKRDFSSVDDLADNLGALSGARITFIDTKGVVWGDSDLSLEEVKGIENHAKRPEVILAMKEGFGSSKRYSTSVKQEMLYVAVFKNSKARDTKYLSRASFSLGIVAEEMRRWQWMFLVIGFLSLIAVSFFGWLAGRMISRAVKREKNHLEQRVTDRTREISLIQTMGGMLNACASIDEVGAIITNIMPDLFPHTHGAVAILKASRNRLEILASWGRPWPIEQGFHPKECWALKKGHQHFSHSESLKIPCPHLLLDLSVQSLCVPLLAQTETIGTFHLLSDAVLTEENTRLVTPLVKQLGLALANIQLRDHLREQAIRDPLTGMYNRRYMMESFEQFLSRAKRKESTVAVMMVDFDHFKRFNDTFGHEAGDFVLVNISREIKRNMRAEDIVCRYGGEEFFLVCPDISLDNAPMVANKLCESIRRLDLSLKKKSLGSLSISIGISVFPIHADSVEGLMKLADEALYRAKSEGRDRTMLAELEPTLP